MHYKDAVPLLGGHEAIAKQARSPRRPPTRLPTLYIEISCPPPCAVLPSFLPSAQRGGEGGAGPPTPCAACAGANTHIRCWRIPWACWAPCVPGAVTQETTWDLQREYGIALTLARLP